jgi:hypothetical protein
VVTPRSSLAAPGTTPARWVTTQWVPEYYADMAKLYQQLGNRRGQALCLYSLAALAEYQGQYA